MGLAGLDSKFYQTQPSWTYQRTKIQTREIRLCLDGFFGLVGLHIDIRPFFFLLYLIIIHCRSSHLGLNQEWYWVRLKILPNPTEPNLSTHENTNPRYQIVSERVLRIGGFAHLYMKFFFFLYLIIIPFFFLFFSVVKPKFIKSCITIIACYE